VAHALRHALLSAFGGYETWTQDAGRRASSLSTVLSLRRICEHSANIRRRRGRAQSPECPRQLQPGLLFRPDRSDHRYGWVPARTYLQTRCTEATGRASCSRVWASKDPTLRTPWTGCKAAEERLVAPARTWGYRSTWNVDSFAASFLQTSRFRPCLPAAPSPSIPKICPRNRALPPAWDGDLRPSASTSLGHGAATLRGRLLPGEAPACSPSVLPTPSSGGQIGRASVPGRRPVAYASRIFCTSSASPAIQCEAGGALRFWRTSKPSPASERPMTRERESQRRAAIG